MAPSAWGRGVTPESARTALCPLSAPGREMPTLNHRLPEADDDGLLVDPGMSLGLRLLALLGAFSFLMLGIASIVPLLQSPPPRPLPDQRQAPVS